MSEVSKHDAIVIHSAAQCPTGIEPIYASRKECLVAMNDENFQNPIRSREYQERVESYQGQKNEIIYESDLVKVSAA